MLEFVMAPNLHWPDTMFSFDHATGAKQRCWTAKVSTTALAAPCALSCAEATSSSVPHLHQWQCR